MQSVESEDRVIEVVPYEAKDGPLLTLTVDEVAIRAACYAGSSAPALVSGKITSESSDEGRYVVKAEGEDRLRHALAIGQKVQY